MSLRYETAWYNELLLSNLLSPVGGGPLSQFVSEQEYSKLFEEDGLGFSTSGQYLSNGQVEETASQYGTFGNISYSFDNEYLHGPGVRANDYETDLNSYGSIKLQVTPRDVVFMQVEFQSLGNGYLNQLYDQRDENSVLEQTRAFDFSPQTVRVPNVPARTYDYHENQDPGVLLLGSRHEWSPGNETLLLLGRLADGQDLTSNQTSVPILSRDVHGLVPSGLGDSVTEGITPQNQQLFSSLKPVVGRGGITDITGGNFDLTYQERFEVYSAEVQQILTLGPDTMILGGRYQSGWFNTQARLTNYDDGSSPFDLPLFQKPPANQNFTVDFERINIYMYHLLKVTPWLSLTGGVTYDKMLYPDNFRDPPVNGGQDLLEKVSPKAGLTLQPWGGATVRGAYTEAISGASFDESVRLEADAGGRLSASLPQPRAGIAHRGGLRQQIPILRVEPRGRNYRAGRILGSRATCSSRASLRRSESSIF